MARTNLGISEITLNSFRALKEEILIHDREIGIPKTDELLTVMIESALLHLPETIKSIRTKRGM